MSSLGIRYYIAVPGLPTPSGETCWDLVEDFDTEEEAQERVSHYTRQGKIAQVIPAKLVTEYGTPLEPEMRQ